MGAFKIDVISAGESHGRVSCRLQSPSSSLNGRNPRCIWQWCSCSKKSNMQPTEGGRPRKKTGADGLCFLLLPPLSLQSDQAKRRLPPSLQRGELSLPSFSSVARSPLHRLHSSSPPCVCVCGELFLRSCVCLSFVCCPMHLVASEEEEEEEEEGWGAFARRSTEKRIRGHRNRGGWGRLNRLCKLPLFVFFCPRRGKCILLIESSSCTGARAKKTTPKQPIPPLLSFCCRSVDNGGRHLNRSERGRKGVAQEGRDRPNFDPVRAPTQGLPQKLNRSNSSANGPHWGLPRSLSLFMQPESNF